MTEVPKIVYDRLRAALPKRALPEQTGPERAHPDADVLTAFAEQTLSATERDGVLEHLACCGDCRELIALALPAADWAATPVAVETEADRATVSRAAASAPHKVSFAWPSLRWAALAAGVAVVAAVLLVHPGKLNQVALPSANRTAVPPVSGPQIASSPAASSPAASSSGATPPTDQLAVLAKAQEPRPTPELRSSKKLKAGKAVAPSRQAESGMLLAENEIADNKNNSKEVDKVSAAPSGGARVLDYNASAIPRSSEAVEVTTESQMVQAEVSSEDRVMAQNNAPPVMKAKPAPQTGTSQQQNTVSAAVGERPLHGRNMVSLAKTATPPSPTLAHNVTWAITAGVLQRSLDSGQSWQGVLRADRPLLCYTSHDEDVWTGGQAGTLFHSANGGVTWEQVRPSIKAQPLTSDITHIDVRGPAEVVISTRNGEIWSSADGGKTWEKK